MSLEPITLHLLRAVSDSETARYADLYHEVVRVNVGRPRDVSELVALSVKISTRGCFRRRYDSPIHWAREDAPRLLESVQRAAPSDAVAQLLAESGNPVQRWIERSDRYFSYLAADHDNRVFKIYLFRTDGGGAPYLDEVDLSAARPALHESAYIDCLEIDLDRPERRAHPVYFKLRANHLSDVLSEDFAPCAHMAPQLLADVAERAGIVAALQRMFDGVRRINDPVIKLRLPAGDTRVDPSALRHIEYAISTNVFDETRLRRVNDCQREIESIGAALGCRDAVASWLNAVRPFCCFLTYVCVGRDFVTLYYKSTHTVDGPPGRSVGEWLPATGSGRLASMNKDSE